MFDGRAEDECLTAVFCICSSHLGFVVDKCLHPNGYKRVFVVVVLSV